MNIEKRYYKFHKKYKTIIKYLFILLIKAIIKTKNCLKNIYQVVLLKIQKKLIHFNKKVVVSLF